MTAPSSTRTSPLSAVLRFGRMVKFSHSVFALPFALAATALAARGHGLRVDQVVAIVLAMIGARTAAMGWNRIVDRRFDAANPRTANREIPSGQIRVATAAILVVLSIGVFVGAAAWLGRLCLYLSPIVLVLVLGYSFTKRFTWLCHVFLGLAIGVAPTAAWVAVRGEFGAPALWLSLAVTTWIGGFDILYALADRDFDRSAGLHSIPARFGVPVALALSALMHLVTIGALVAAGLSANLGIIYWVGVTLVGVLCAYEHAIVKPSDLSRVNVAFFNLNGYVSIVYFAATVIDVLARK
jgi:4-hydroxybenzoate polyprenyltransferase